jgi:predicted secreted protein
MRIGSLIAIYFVVWWTILFAVLPWGNRTQAEAGSVEPGSAPSAPVKPRLVLKAAATTILAALIVAAMAWARSAGFSIDDLPALGPR